MKYVVAIILFILFNSGCNEWNDHQTEFQLRLVEESAGEALDRKTLHYTGEQFYLGSDTIISNKHVLASEFDDYRGVPSIAVQLNENGTDILLDVTARNINKRIAVLLDGEIVSAPVILDTIKDGRITITGDFTVAEAERYAETIIGQK